MFNLFSYCCAHKVNHTSFMVLSRRWLGHLLRKNEGEDKLPCPAKDASQQADNHNYFVLEKHVKEVDKNDKLQESNGHYALAQDPTYYEVTNGEPEDDYDTTDQCQLGRGKPTQPGNVYNTVKDFQQQDDYDHISDQKQPLRVPENEYNTTQDVMTSDINDDTYNHLNERPKTTPRPDNVYGMPRVDNDYDSMPPVSGTNGTDGHKGGDGYAKIGKFQ